MNTEPNKVAIRFYFGIERERDGENRMLDARDVIRGLSAIKLLASELFGGYTLTNAYGGWKSPSGLLIEEQSVVLEVISETSPGLSQASVRVNSSVVTPLDC